MVAAVCAAGITAAAGCRRSQSAAAADAQSWADPSAHSVSFVPVAPGVSLEVLDWGGTGPALVFLAGLGNTAHAYDEFAPRFLDRFRVVAITRRGFGASSHPASGYDSSTLASDVVTVLDSMRLDRAVLAGHSIAALELTAMATHHADRVPKIVFLDTFCSLPGVDSLLQALYAAPMAGLAVPTVPGDADTLTAAAYVAFVHRTRGVHIPEADIRARYAADGWNEELGAGYQGVLATAMGGGSACAGVKVPALAIVSRRDSISQEEPHVRADTAAWPVQRTFQGLYGEVTRALAAEYPRVIAGGRVEIIEGGHHWVFVSHADQVERLMRDFLR